MLCFSGFQGPSFVDVCKFYCLEADSSASYVVVVVCAFYLNGLSHGLVLFLLKEYYVWAAKG